MMDMKEEEEIEVLVPERMPDKSRDTIVNRNISSRYYKCLMHYAW
jgi:hypothetical protein